MDGVSIFAKRVFMLSRFLSKRPSASSQQSFLGKLDKPCNDNGEGKLSMLQMSVPLYIYFIFVVLHNSRRRESSSLGD